MNGRRLADTDSRMPLSGRGLLGLLAVCIVTVGLGYSGVIDAFFVADDHVILFGLRGPMGADALWPLHGSPFFRPLLGLSFAADWHLFGTSPRAMHLHGLVLHTLGAWLLGVVTARWTRSVLAGMATAVLFASSPLHPEAVTWISARGYPLAGCFTLATMLLLREGSIGARALVLGFVVAAAAMLSVEAALPLVAYPLALGWGLRRRSGWALGVAVAVATVAYLALRVAWLGGLGGYRAEDGGTVHASFAVGHVLAYFGQAVGHLVAPGPWDGADGGWVSFLVVAAMVLAGLAHAAAPQGRASLRVLLALSVCVLAALSVTAGWGTLGSDLSGVRYLYFASMFWYVGLAWSTNLAVTAGGGRRRTALAALAALALVQIVTLRAVNARWAESADRTQAAVLGVAERVRERGSRHLFLFGVPAGFRGAHALPWAIEPAMCAFAGRDLRVEVIVDAAQFALAQRAYATTAPAERTFLDVGAFDAETKRWRWE